MKVLTVYANPSPRSFCHTILEQFLRVESSGFFPYGFAFSLTPEGWQGEIGVRVPLFHHQKALLISTTIFNEKAYQGGIGQAMKRLMDDFGFHYPGIKNVEHVYFYSVGAVDAVTRQDYLQQAYCLGKEFAPG